jgi:hypothetical protein
VRKKKEDVESGWFSKLVTKKETEEEKIKRLKDETIIKKQNSATWGNDILEDLKVDADADADADEKEKDGDKGETAAAAAAAKVTDDDDGNDENEKKEEDDSSNLPWWKKIGGGGEDNNNEKTDDVVVGDDKDKGKDDNNNNNNNINNDKRSSWFANRGMMTSSRNKRGNANAAAAAAKDKANEENIEEKTADDIKDMFKKKKPKTVTEEEEKQEQEEEGISNNNADEKEDTIADVTNNNDGDGDDNRRSSWMKGSGNLMTSVRNRWGRNNNNSSSSKPSIAESSSTGRGEDHHDDDSDTRSTISGITTSTANNIGNALGNTGHGILNFWKHTRAKFDPEVWADPKVQILVHNIDELRTKLNESRHTHRISTRKAERQLEKSILQQKQFLARQLYRKANEYKRDSYASCVKEVYEKEILEVLHKDTSDEDELELKDISGDDEQNKDAIDGMLDSVNFDYEYKPPGDNNSEDGNGDGDGDVYGDMSFSKKNKAEKKMSGDKDGKKVIDSPLEDDDKDKIDHATLIPLEVKVLRAHHNEWMTQNQMEKAKTLQQREMECLYEIMPQQQNEHDLLPSLLQPKIDNLWIENKLLKDGYQEHIDVQEKIIALLRDHVSPEDRLPPPPLSPEEEKEEEEEAAIAEEEKDDTFDQKGISSKSFDENVSPLASPIAQQKKSTRGNNMWAQNLQTSIRSLLVAPPMKEEEEEEEEEAEAEDNNSNGGSKDDDIDDDDDSSSSSSSSADSSSVTPGIITSPITGGSERKKYRLSFGGESPAVKKDISTSKNSNSGIIANFSAPPLTTGSSNSEDGGANKQPTTRTVDKSLLPESLAERRAKRAAAREESNWTASSIKAGTSASKPAEIATSTSTSTSGTAASTPSNSTVPSSLAERRAKRAAERAALTSSSGGGVVVDKIATAGTDGTASSAAAAASKPSRSDLLERARNARKAQQSAAAAADADAIVALSSPPPPRRDLNASAAAGAGAGGRVSSPSKSKRRNSDGSNESFNSSSMRSFGNGSIGSNSSMLSDDRRLQIQQKLRTNNDSQSNSRISMMPNSSERSLQERVSRTNTAANNNSSFTRVADDSSDDLPNSSDDSDVEDDNVDEDEGNDTGEFGEAISAAS